uniref:HRDC domain-containing protein n=1 Tax=uncultured Clostridium sp. TaxID=59620 RepID=UPI0026340CB9
LRGMVGPKIINDKLNELTTYGIMKEYSSKFIRDLIRGMIDFGYVNLREGTYSMLQLNEKSYSILRSKQKVILKLSYQDEEKIINSELFNKLRNWRRETAIREGVKPYIIFSDATLIELCNKLPKTQEELLEIRGMGEKKFNKYGEEILEKLKN